MELHEYTEQQLQAELQRRKDAFKPEPAFKCMKCGEVGYFHGTFSATNFERQHAQWTKLHSTCQSYFGGGGI